MLNNVLVPCNIEQYAFGNHTVYVYLLLYLYVYRLLHVSTPSYLSRTHTNTNKFRGAALLSTNRKNMRAVELVLTAYLAAIIARAGCDLATERAHSNCELFLGS